MRISRGTTLICVATHDGIFLAADDLVHVEQDGQAIPTGKSFRKVGSVENILIGTSGLMICGAINYDVQDWLPELLEEHGRATTKLLPSLVAEAIHARLKQTFKAAEPLVGQGVLKGYRPGGRLLSYVVAGYAKSFKQPYVFETGVELNGDGNGLVCVSPLQHRKQLPQNVRFGEDHFIERANNLLGPERSLYLSLTETILSDVNRILPNIPEALLESVACTVSLVKVEAHFNPQIGSTVNVVLLDRTSRQTCSAPF